jgi:hypothetical protein
MDISAKAVDWGVGPAAYLVLWCGLFVIAAFVVMGVRLVAIPGPLSKLVASLFAVGAALIVIVVGKELSVIYRFASWPPFSFRYFFVGGLPVIVPTAVGLAWRIWARRPAPPN